MPLPRSIAALFASISLAAAQTPPAADGMIAPPALIDQLVANAEQYRLTLPSLTADEDVDSQGSFLSLFREHVVTRGTFRVMRKTPGGPLEESRQITVYDGKPVAPDHHKSLPIVLFGGFGKFQEIFLTPAHRGCFDFTLLPQSGPGDTLQIAVTATRTPSTGSPCPAVLAAVTGLLLVDRETHQLRHFERTVPADVASQTHLAPFASVDCAPTRVGDDTYWLPTVVIGRIVNGKVHGTFTARYSNYHRYTASMRLLPGAEPVDSPPPAPSPAPPPAP